MNNCSFVGKVYDHPVLQKEKATGAKFVILELVIEEVRKSRKGEYKKSYDKLYFEAWDSAAETICSRCPKGTLMSIESSARFDDEAQETYFRINSFKVLS